MEVPLVAVELEAVDGRLASAEHTLFWHHEGTNPPVAAQGQRSSLWVSGGPWPLTLSHLPPSDCPQVPTAIPPKTWTPTLQAWVGGWGAGLCPPPCGE